MRGLGRRLERLEDLAGGAPGQRGGWPVEGQLEDVLDSLWLHRCGRYVYAATDREIHLMGLLCARWELPEGWGEHRYPSGAVVRWIDDGEGGALIEATDPVQVEDLPEGVREYFERMDPTEQPERERKLYERRRLPGEPTARERARLHRERARAFEEESERRDRALIEENRRACGLPPLEDD